jgi:hypothetical protein
MMWWYFLDSGPVFFASISIDVLAPIVFILTWREHHSKKWFVPITLALVLFIISNVWFYASIYQSVSAE